MVSDLPPEIIRSLLNQIALKDDKAISEIYLHYQKSIYAFAQNRTGNDDLAGEVVQETFLAVFLKPSAYDFQSKFSSWLCSIAKHKSVDLLRKHGRAWSRSVELDNEMIEILPSDQIAILERMEGDERDEILRACIERLSVEQREAMLLVYHQGASIDEVAGLQDIPQGTVKTRLFHARKKVQDCIRRAYGSGVSYA